MKKLNSKFGALLVMVATFGHQAATAATVNMRASVPAICEMRYEMSGAGPVITAELAVFCNAAEGARLTAILLDGDEGGYVISGPGTSAIATPGSEIDLRSYSSATARREYFQIMQVSGNAVTPTIVFEITPES